MTTKQKFDRLLGEYQIIITDHFNRQDSYGIVLNFIENELELKIKETQDEKEMGMAKDEQAGVL